MGNAELSLAQRESMLRRVAIVVSSLPAKTASTMLGSIDSQSRNLVHQAISTLTRVDAAERSETIGLFKQRVHARLSEPTSVTVIQSTGSVQDEVVIGDRSSAIPTNTPISNYDQQRAAVLGNDVPKESKASFAFLADAPVDDLAELLSEERAQTIALVLASIPPKQAAEVLPLLNANTQSQTLSRIGRLDGVDEATKIALADHLRLRLENQTALKNGSGSSKALEAIIAEMPNISANIDQQRSPIGSELDSPTLDATPSLKIADGTWPSERAAERDPAAAQHNYSSSDDGTTIQIRPRTSLPIASSTESATDDTHQYLVDLPAADLVSALGQVTTHQALLTLCGLPNRTAESALALLPRKKAKAARQGLSALGGLQLRDIDSAKQAVAEIAKTIAQNSSKNLSRAA